MCLIIREQEILLVLCNCPPRAHVYEELLTKNKLFMMLARMRTWLLDHDEKDMALPFLNVKRFWMNTIHV